MDNTIICKERWDVKFERIEVSILTASIPYFDSKLGVFKEGLGSLVETGSKPPNNMCRLA